jgi:hypothetical protein
MDGSSIYLKQFVPEDLFLKTEQKIHILSKLLQFVALVYYYDVPMVQFAYLWGLLFCWYGRTLSVWAMLVPECISLFNAFQCFH